MSRPEPLSGIQATVLFDVLSPSSNTRTSLLKTRQCISSPRSIKSRHKKPEVLLRTSEDGGGEHLRDCVVQPHGTEPGFPKFDRGFVVRPSASVPSLTSVVDVYLAPSKYSINFHFNSGTMHSRRGGKIFSFSRHIQVRTTATATKQAVSARIPCQQAHLLPT